MVRFLKIYRKVFEYSSVVSFFFEMDRVSFKLKENEN